MCVQVRTEGNTICPSGRYRNAQKYVGPLSGGGRDPMYTARSMRPRKRAVKVSGGEGGEENSIHCRRSPAHSIPLGQGHRLQRGILGRERRGVPTLLRSPFQSRFSAFAKGGGGVWPAILGFIGAHFGSKALLLLIPMPPR